MYKIIPLLPALWISLAHSAVREPVDAAVVLAVDVSASIIDSTDSDGRNEYGLQVDGILAALRDPELAYVLENCNDAGVALTYVEWSGEDGPGEHIAQRTPWRKLRTKKDLHDLADGIGNLAERSFNGQTDILTALRASARLIEQSPFEGLRKIISLSSDGFQNVMGAVDMAESSPDLRLLRGRDELVGSGFVIDSLVVTSDAHAKNTVGDLEQYHRLFVKGGKGSVVTAVADFEDFARGLKRNLIRELDNCAL